MVSSELINVRTLYKTGFYWIIAVLCFLITLTSIFTYFDLDRTISSWFYLGRAGGWALVESQPWKWLYEFGTIPGFLLTLGAVILYVLSHLKTRWTSWRRYAILLILSSLIGGGVLVNAVLKDYWGRPRPRQIQEFQGKWEYRHPYQPGIAGKGKSFPCGHCTMGYLFVTCAFLYRKSKFLAISGTGFGIVYGFLMSIARIGQGGHYASDTFWALGIILLTALVLYYWVLKIPLYANEPLSSVSSPYTPAVCLGAIGVIFVMIAVFSTRRPLYQEHRTYHFTLDTSTSLKVQTHLAPEDFQIMFTQQIPQGSIQAIVRGFGWPDTTDEILIQRRSQGETFFLEYDLSPKGYYSEKSVIIFLKLPHSFRGKVEIERKPEAMR
ncbi:phosphatase PAP2 family protein [Deltaproteobacteria bacterium TL4]